MAMKVPIALKGKKTAMLGGRLPAEARAVSPGIQPAEVDVFELEELPPPAFQRSRSQSSTRSSVPSASTGSPRNVDSAAEEPYVSSAVSFARSTHSSSSDNERKSKKNALASRSLAPPICQRHQDSWCVHSSSSLLLARSRMAVQKNDLLDRRHSFYRAALIRANACRLSDRFCISDPNTLVGKGTFGRVYECVDFGLSEVSCQESPARSEHIPGHVQKRDIWSVGTILYQILAGSRLFPQAEEKKTNLGLLPCATNPNYVPARLKEFDSSDEDSMTFADFRVVMTPVNYKPPVVSAAFWADVPDFSSPLLGAKKSPYAASKHQERIGCSSDPEHDAPPQAKAVVSRVTSAPSLAFNIRQNPGFHRTTLRPYYESQPVSNVVLGLASGSSGYARRAVQLGCSELVETEHGAFFFMPNPKYHWTPEAAFNDERKARFVAWWIHPDLCAMLKSWTGQATSGSDDCNLGDLESGVGAPGDFGYSQVQKRPDYLHTCRDLCGVAHIRLLDALTFGTKQYLERMFGESLPAAHVSAGFHYPVRPQYSALHLQIRVNSGDVCPGEGRGVDLFRLQNRLESDPECFQRDDERLFYEATANLRTALLKACDKAGTAAREVGPMSLVLGSGRA